GNVACILRNDRVMARWSGKPRLASGDGGFTDQMFAFVKKSFLFAGVNDDLCRPRGAFVIPPTRRSCAGVKAGLVRCGVLFATANNQCDEACTYNVQQTAGVHEGGYL